MNTFSFPQISVNYKDADAAKRTLVNSSRVSYDIFKEAYDECMQHHEECWVMFLNQANRLLGLSCISKCGISQTVVDVRIILQTALLAHASGIILSHNHPSGNMVASSSDNSITSKLKKACEILDITLLDHIILWCGYGHWYKGCLSFRRRAAANCHCPCDAEKCSYYHSG